MWQRFSCDPQVIFKAFHCQAYDEDSELGLTRSFLDADLEVQCDGSLEHARIKLLAYVFMVLWPAGLVLLYTVLLMVIGRRRRAGTLDALTRQTSFLHASYTLSYNYWEALELVRRTILLGWVILVDVSARLVVGLLVSLVWLVALLTAKPYVRMIDNVLAACCATALVFIFLGGHLVRIYEQIASAWQAQVGGAEEETAVLSQRIVGFLGAEVLTAWLIGLCMLSVVIAACTIVYEMRLLSRAVRARWERDHTFVVPRECTRGRFHTFISHNWRSAQDQARSIKQLLSALVPGLRVRTLATAHATHATRSAPPPRPLPPPRPHPLSPTWPCRCPRSGWTWMICAARLAPRRPTPPTLST